MEKQVYLGAEQELVCVSSEVDLIFYNVVHVGSFFGQYSNISSVTLGATDIEEALKRANIKTDEIDQVIMGQVLTTGCGQIPARQALLKANIPLDVPGFTLNMVCGSGLKRSQNYEPIEMGLDPIKSVRKVVHDVEKSVWSVDEIDLFELKEAFAVQSLIVVKALKVDMTGGALSLGPRLVLPKSKGIASLCIGGGMGIAIAIQRD